MKLVAEGRITDRIAVAGNAHYPGYVVTGDGGSCMIDCGVNLYGPLYRRTLDEILGDARRLTWLLLTHSHYDHLGAMPYLKRQLPDLKTAGARRVDELLSRESVRAHMHQLSEVQRPLYRDIVGDEDVRLEAVPLDRCLEDGDELTVGGFACRVMAVPGHTRDSLAYWFPELGALFPGEAVGVPEGLASDIHEVQVVFLSSYDDYCASLARLASLRPLLIAMGHGYVFTDDDCQRYLEASLAATVRYRRLIEDYLDRAGGDIARTIETMVAREYDEKGTIFQERNAYITNLTAQVKHIAGLTRN